MINDLKGFEIYTGRHSMSADAICELIKYTKEQNAECLFNCIRAHAIQDRPNENISTQSSNETPISIGGEYFVKVYLHIVKEMYCFVYSVDGRPRNVGIRFTFFVSLYSFLRKYSNTIDWLNENRSIATPFHMDYLEGRAILSSDHDNFVEFSEYVEEAKKKIGTSLSAINRESFIVNKIINNLFPDIKRQFDEYMSPYVGVRLNSCYIPEDNKFIIDDGSIFDDFEMRINSMRFRDVSKIRDEYRGQNIAVVKVRGRVFKFIFSLRWEELLLFCIHHKVNEITIMDYETRDIDARWVSRFSSVVFGPDTYCEDNTNLSNLVVDFFGINMAKSKQI